MLFLLAAAVCITIDGESIRVGDIARGIPSFAAADPQVLVGLAPAFGANRTMAPSEVIKLAARYNVDLPVPQGICFARPSRHLDAAELKEALERALPEKGTNIDVVDFAAYPVPIGTMAFTPSGLQRSSMGDGTRVWHGRVEYGNHRSYPVWAKVRIHCRRTMVVATSMIPAGAIIRDADVAIEERETDPGSSPVASRLEEVIGKVARTRIAGREGVRMSTVSLPPIVKRGEDVEVTVQSGQASLRLTARAQKAGRTGETIPVRNPVSGRIFPVRVEGEGHAVAEGVKR
jgi:flagella basal body P-ring formation protein FlgA